MRARGLWGAAGSGAGAGSGAEGGAGAEVGAGAGAGVAGRLEAARLSSSASTARSVPGRGGGRKVAALSSAVNFLCGLTFQKMRVLCGYI